MASATELVDCAAMPRELMLVERARDQLVEAVSLGEIMQLRNVGKAAELCAQLADCGVEARNAAAELIIRAERKAGELLQAVDRHSAGRPKKNGHVDEPFRPTLENLGVTKRQSSRFQQIASVPDEAFEDHLDRVKSAGKELTTASVIKLARQQPTMNGDDARMAEALKTARDIESREERTSAVLAELGGVPFGTVYADPPWKYSNTATRANAEGEYAGTMTVDEICAMPVKDMVAETAHLHLWTTNGFLPDAFRVIEAWGFEYKSCFVWVKPRMGTGNYWRLAHEFLLLGTRGTGITFPAGAKGLRSWAEYPRGEHSEKPEAIRGMIELASPGPYLELFGRKEVPGWRVFGNQIDRQRRLA